MLTEVEKIAAELDISLSEVDEESTFEEKTTCIISHESKSYYIWWTLIAILSMVSGFTTPLAMAFYPEIKNAELPLDIFFYVDIVMTFFVSVPHRGLEKVNTTEHFKIALKYAELYLWLDILSVFPFERIFGDEGYFQFLRLFRLFRLRRFFPLLVKLEKVSWMPYFWLSMFKYLMMAVYNSHWSACIFFTLAEIHNFDDSSWVFNNSPGLEDEPTSTQYVTSLYWAITTLTTVGYRDISPQNNDERAWVMIYMLINLALTSYLIGNMTQLVSKGDSKTAQFREYLDAISKFMRQNGVKANLQQRVIKFIVLQNRLSITLRTEAMRELPSALRLPIREQLYQDLFSDIDIFRNVSEQFIEKLLGYVKEELYMAGMEIMKAGDFGTSLYIIREGECAMMLSKNLSSGAVREKCEVKPCAIIMPGGYFGAASFFAGLAQPCTIKAIKPCLVIKIEESFKSEMVGLLARDLHRVLKNLEERYRKFEMRIRLKKLGFGMSKLYGSQRGFGMDDTIHSHNPQQQQHQQPSSPPATEAAVEMTKIEVKSITATQKQQQSKEGNNCVIGDQIKKNEVDNCDDDDDDGNDETSPLSPKNLEVPPSKESRMELKEKQRKTVGLSCMNNNPLDGTDEKSSVGLDDSIHGIGSTRRNNAPSLPCESKYRGGSSTMATRKSHSSRFKIKITSRHWNKEELPPILESLRLMAEDVYEAIIEFTQHYEHDMSAALCQLASMGNHKGLQSSLNGMQLDNDEGDYDGRVPLHLAAANGHLEACKVLIAHHADLSHQDRAGRTPLLEAVENKHDKVIQLLLEKKATLDLENTGEYLCNAAFRGNVNLVKRLCIAGADVDSGDYDKRCALHLAAAEGQLNVCEVLVEAKADVDVRDRWGESPIESALQAKHKNVFKFLCQFSKREKIKKMMLLNYKEATNSEGVLVAAAAADLGGGDGSARSPLRSSSSPRGPFHFNNSHSLSNSMLSSEFKHGFSSFKAKKSS